MIARLTAQAMLIIHVGLSPAAWADMPPAQDPAEVMASELNQAYSLGSNAALILFIARFPNDPLADQARQALLRRTAPDPAPDPGPDGDIIIEFDRARLTGTPAALAHFSARYAGHPLAIEADLAGAAPGGAVTAVKG